MERSEGPFGFEEAGDSPGFLLWQLTNLWQQAIHAVLSPFGITHVQFVLLASLAWLEKSGGAVSQVALARHAHTDVMMTSQVLRVLEAKGLLRREANPSDSRARRMVLTEAGHRIVGQTVPAVEAADGQFFGKLDAESEPGDTHSAQSTDFTRAMHKLVSAHAGKRPR